MTEPRKRLALVTGASGGIGLEFVQLFARDGYDLVLVARSAQKLEHLAADLKLHYGVDSLCIAADLAHPNAPGSILRVLQENEKQVDVLVNNAGSGLVGPFLELDRLEQLRMIQLNVLSLVDLTHRLARGMKERGFGRILNVASTAAFQPGPLMAIYFATKAFVLSFSEALANELAGTGITVTCLCPGPTATDFQERAKMSEVRMASRGKMMTAAEVAQQGYAAMNAGKLTHINGVKNRLLAFAIRFLPRRTVLKLVRRRTQTDERPETNAEG